MRSTPRRSRRGTVLPLIGVCLIGLFAFVGLAIDLGMLAVSRTQAQNAADVSALVATRTLNNKPGVANSNLIDAVSQGKTSAKSNPHLSVNFTDADISKIEVGQYNYDPVSQTFAVTTWTDVTNDQTATPTTGSWTAIRVTLATEEPTYFMKVMGVNKMPSGATAVAVYRPRDVAFVLDMTGSMAYSCQFNSGNVTNNAMDNQSLNPDNLYPTFGHYQATNSKLYATANQTISTGEFYPRNNYSISTPGGPPILRNFYFSASNLSTPTTSASVTTVAGTDPVTGLPTTVPILLNAFHRWSPSETGADSTTYTPPTYDFTGYNAFHKGDEADPKGPVPAPDSYKTMTDTTTTDPMTGLPTTGIAYTGDRWRRADGSINKSDATWTGTYRAANHAADLLGYGANPPTAGVTPAFTTTYSDFRDPVWETYGYDLDIPKYRTARGATNGPLDPVGYLTSQGGTLDSILVPAADRFVGYSMGPGYWGKTFFIWPPDPRTPVGNPGDTGYVAGDWRLRYFLNRTGGALDSQADNNSTTTGTDNFDAVNEVILRNGGGLTVSAYGSTGTPNWRINYAAVLKWIKTGPLVLPTNLRAGRVLYYTSIPDDVNTATGTDEQKLDKVFWKNYIDWVIGWNYTGATNLYGTGDSWAAATATILQTDTGSYKFSWEATGKRPYMRYTDSPSRPRLHLWFGPLSMCDFIANIGRDDADGDVTNWNPGTCYEAQCWQLKAGVNSVIDDVRNNHPNDFVGMVMFSAPHHNGIRVKMGQDYTTMKNALFYPKSLLDDIGGGGVTTELRPYDINFVAADAAEIPSAGGSTDPCTGLAYAYNLLSPSSLLPTSTYGTIKGRRGASKIVIFETDGVPNTYRTPTPTLRGYNTYYTLGGSSGNIGNNHIDARTPAENVTKQIVKPMATVTTSGVDSGLSLGNAPARVYPIGFGDLFDTTTTAKDDALKFLGKIAEFGGTGPAGATTIASNQIIAGPYSQRITRLRDCLQTIFQSGVTVTLIQ